MDERLKELGSRPISADLPTGENAKYDEEYELLTAELAKLESISGDNSVDWEQIISLATNILDAKSKDLLIASYLTQGLFIKQGLSGLGTGLTVISDMLQTFYDGLFPPLKRVKARSNALSWLADKAEPMVSEMNPGVKDFTTFESCLQQVTKIQAMCDEKMAEQSPTLGAFRRSLKNWRDHLKIEVDKAQKAKEEKESQQVAQKETTEATPLETTNTDTPEKPVVKPAAPAKPSMTPVAASAVNDDKDVKAAIKSVQDIGKKIALFKRQSSAADPVAYSLLRTCIWMQIERLPPNENQQTQLPEIDADRQNLLKNLLDNQAYGDLVNAAESAFCDSMFWLTAHRYTASALEALGHSQAKQAMTNSVAAFVNNFPGIRELKFVSGTPFADEMTQIWLDEQVLGGSGSGGAAIASDPWNAGLQDALSLAGKGKAVDGIALIKSGENAGQDGRQRFMWQLCCAQYLVKTGNVVLAVPHLEHLWEQLVSRNLCEWESQTTLTIARNLLTCFEHKALKSGMNEARKALEIEMRSIVYRLDVEAALGKESK